MIKKQKAFLTGLLAAAILAQPIASAKIQGQMDQLRYCDHERKINFDPKVSAGNLFLRLGPTRVNGKMVNGHEKLFGLAQGPVKIPANSYLTLKLGSAFFRKPDMLAKLPADSIDCLQVAMLSMDDSEDNLCDESLGHLNNLTGLQAIQLDKSDATDVGLSKLAKLVNLVYISAFLTNIQGHGLKDLAALKRLKFLSFHSTPIASKNVVYLANFAQLEMLDLTRTGIDSSAINYLAKCPNLVSLDISDNIRITDSAIPALASLKKLRHLNLGNTSITFDGLSRLKGLTPKYMAMPRAITKKQLPAVQAMFPNTIVAIQGGDAKKVDDETGTIFGVMSRDRKLK